MGKLKNLEWKNIYYMVCYCIDELQYFKPSYIDHEELNGTHDLLAALLTKSFEVLIKNGYIREYNKNSIVTDRPRGNINIPKSIQTGSYGKGKLNCNVTNFDMNNKLNQVIKAAFSILISTNNVVDDKIDKKLLARLNEYREMLRKVDDISIDNKTLESINDIPQWYKPIMVVCGLIINDWITLDSTGKHRLLELDDKARLCYIWQKYGYEYCLLELPKRIPGCKISKPTYEDGDKKDANGNWVPSIRHLDLLIENPKEKSALIVDFKWYENENADSTSNRDQANKYCNLYIAEHSDYDVVGALFMASNSETDCVGRTHTNGIATFSYNININQSMDKLNTDILNTAINYVTKLNK
jgi:5-methylcytosine-specific restriction endonuclease McrBC regulatory subunit McrC